MEYRTAVTGFPRIGERRELKKALERYWAGKSSIEELESASAELRKKHWLLQRESGIDLISCNDFSWYDQVLDTALMLGAVPARFRGFNDPRELYFAMARGTGSTVAMEMTKWFNTNYHYIVPELDDSMEFHLDPSKILAEYREARELGIRPKINLIGPLSFLGLSKREDGGDPYAFFERVLPIYTELMKQLSELDSTVYVQLEEPVFVCDPDQHQLELLETAYNRLAGVSGNLRIIVTTYFEHSGETTAVLARTPVWGLGLDFVHGPRNLESLQHVNDKQLIAGVVDGRNVWINDFDATLKLLESIAESVDRKQITISTSCSLLHVPYGLDGEPEGTITQWLSFAAEKLKELTALSALFHSAAPPKGASAALERNRAAVKARRESPYVTDPEVLRQMESRDGAVREGEFPERIRRQRRRLQLPPLPATTIGSFPQTRELRRLRRDYRKVHISEAEYEQGIKDYINECVAFQESVGLDVLVHGEPERNDMVEYFGQMLNGFHFTENGWVQSYGSRCVKPPIIYGDVSRPAPMTVGWITYAQSRTSKPMKGMLTGPVTILNWSFVRDDLPRPQVSRQIALALRDEIDDLQQAGIKIVQVDEPAFKEGYPLRRERVAEYEQWSVANFKLAVSKARMETQIHTHMCYSEFNDIIRTIESMDADVITIETARSGNSLLDVFREAGYKNEIGPGVYDIHSPRVPSVEEFTSQIRSRLEVLPLEQLWVNPDCGLKTRAWEEVKPALSNMVAAVREVRAEQQQAKKGSGSRQ
jgi:5-methyltetrahydropteroyltriglutamate--homocysteine methyltransferase